MNQIPSKYDKKPFTLTDEQKFEQYLVIDKAVTKYQNENCKESAEVIINAFLYTICWKYLNIIVNARIFDTEDPSAGRFIRLFETKSVHFKRIRDKYKTLFAMGITPKNLERIQAMFSRASFDDLEQICILTLLWMAKRYKPVREGYIGFHNYVHKSFYLYFFNELKKFYIDPASLNKTLEIRGDIFEDEKAQEGFELALYSAEFEHSKTNANRTFFEIDKAKSPYSSDFLDLNWENGLTCSSYFDNLSAFERRVLVMFYYKNMSDQAIADEFAFYRLTIRDIRLEAVRKVTENARQVKENGENY